MGGENIQKGTGWVANLSRLSFDVSKKHVMLLKEQGVPLIDDEINFIQESLIAIQRQMVSTVIGDGSPDNGFLVVGNGAANDFTVSAGNILVDGWLLKLGTDTTYSAQPVAQAGLTTPGGARTDLVYLDLWLDEINQAEDVTIIDPVLATRTSTRLKLFWAVKVAVGVSVPANGMDGSNLYHWHYQIANLARTASSGISVGMVTDTRAFFNVRGAGQTIFNVDATAGPVNINLPVSGEVIIIKTDPTANPVTITATGGKTILRQASLLLGAGALELQDESIHIIMNGTNWFRI